MWTPACFLVLALGASAAPFSSCGPQNIVLKQITDKWTLPTTKMAPMTTCTYTFDFPNGTFAEINLSGSNLTSQDTIYAAGILSPFKGTNDNYTLSTVSPSKFEVTFSAGQNSKMSVNCSIALQKVNGTVVNSFRVMKSNESRLIYLDEWKVGTSYKVAADTLVRLGVAFNGINNKTRSQLNNIFIYDGLNGTTLLGSESAYHLSRNKNVTLYLARNITGMEGALFLTDNSNINGTINHRVQYVPTEVSQPSNYAAIVADWQSKPDAPWGAVTIIGKRQGTPFDVRGLYSRSGSGTFLHARGGPLPNHPNGKAFAQKDLPLRADGAMNTFYLTQGDANFKYTIN